LLLLAESNSLRSLLAARAHCPFLLTNYFLLTHSLARSSLYTIVFAGPNEERRESELENERREEIGQQLHQALIRRAALSEIQTLVKLAGVSCRL
jgi:hypothetical protein